MSKRNLLSIIIVTFLPVIVYIWVQLFYSFKVSRNKFEIYIEKGTSFRSAVDILYNEGIIKDRNLFIILGRITGLDKRLIYGYYKFLGEQSAYDVLSKLLRGEIEEYNVIFKEGETLADLGERLEELNIIDKMSFLKLATDRSLLNSLSIDAPSLEGYVFPTRYKIPKGTDPVDMIRYMVDTMRRMARPYLDMGKEMGFTENEVLTLASIIEKEARTDDERPVISAVYHNRLKRKMRLQADPTTVYELKGTKKLVTRRDLLRKSEYNTYIKRGLPPGPIASPGLKSIIAAVKPAEVPYLYFVSNRDGTHTFSVEYKEHIDAIIEIKRKIRLNRQ